MNEDEKICGMCGGTGEISTIESVYPNEPHTASVGSEPCPKCRPKEDWNDRNEDQ